MIIKGCSANNVTTVCNEYTSWKNGCPYFVRILRPFREVPAYSLTGYLSSFVKSDKNKNNNDTKKRTYE